jgi:hypothetical protein
MPCDGDYSSFLTAVKATAAVAPHRNDRGTCADANRWDNGVTGHGGGTGVGCCFEGDADDHTCVTLQLDPQHVIDIMLCDWVHPASANFSHVPRARRHFAKSARIPDKKGWRVEGGGRRVEGRGWRVGDKLVITSNDQRCGMGEQGGRERRESRCMMHTR